MPEPRDTTPEWIAGLANPNPQAREKAARELFRLGCADADPVFSTWFADPEFRALARPGNTLLTVGVAVEPARFAAIRSACGAPRLADVPADQDALEFTVVFPHGVRLDVLTARDAAGAGPIARFLSRFGEGIQQVECDVRDVSRATEILQSRFSLAPIYHETRTGADGTRVNFFLVPTRSSASGEDRKVLIELVEVAGKPKNK